VGSVFGPWENLECTLSGYQRAKIGTVNYGW